MPTVSDTSPISNLARIGRLELLRKQFRDLWIPFAVVEELTEHRSLVQLLSATLDRGESEAIALALEIGAEILLIDEQDGRQTARQLGLTSTGVLGILLRAKADGEIAAVGPEISKLRELARFYVTRAIEDQVLHLAGE